jgi:hypothetical protein
MDSTATLRSGNRVVVRLTRPRLRTLMPGVMRRRSVVVAVVGLSCVAGRPALAAPDGALPSEFRDRAVPSAAGDPASEFDGDAPPVPDDPDTQASMVRFEPGTPDLILVNDNIRHADVRTYNFRDVVYTETARRYSVICKGPCERPLPAARYDLAISKDGRAPEEAGVVDLTRPSLLHASYIDRRSQRYLGLAIALVGFGVGNAMIIPGTAGAHDDATLIGVGAATAVVGLAVGAYFGFRDDEAHIEVVPLDAAPRPALATPIGTPPQAQGIALRLRF